jgi:very-short-patch-repair endonuclease
MTFLVITSLIIVAVIIILKALSNIISKTSKPDYQKRKLLTDTEFKFYNELKKIIPADQIILTKIRLADLIKQKNFSDFRRISQKHVDFVLAQNATLDIVGIIELDDHTHQKQHRIKRDQFVNAALNSAGIPITHIKVEKIYNKQLLTNQIQRDIYNKTPITNAPTTPQSAMKTQSKPLYPWQIQ